MGGSEHLADEVLQGWHHGERVTRVPLARLLRNDASGVSNFFGLLAWLAGAVLWLTALPAVRRLRYDWFISAHQLHALWWLFALCHWPGMLCFVFPS